MKAYAKSLQNLHRLAELKGFLPCFKIQYKAIADISKLSQLYLCDFLLFSDLPNNLTNICR